MLLSSVLPLSSAMRSSASTTALTAPRSSSSSYALPCADAPTAVIRFPSQCR